jgi:hypothetical protein
LLATGKPALTAGVCIDALLLMLLLPLLRRDMVAEFEAVSVAMSQPDADLDALTNKMGRLQVRHQRRTRRYTGCTRRYTWCLLLFG